MTSTNDSLHDLIIIDSVPELCNIYNCETDTSHDFNTVSVSRGNLSKFEIPNPKLVIPNPNFYLSISISIS